ncbi:MAG: hypothetical protein GY851_19930, partial [bacterium]|nr:hypothetical protein [bacterium]
GGLINGNVSIHGSVHLLGDALPEGGIAVTALDLSGSSLIHNNYTGLDAGLRARIPAPPRTIHGGEDVETLSAKLRVKNGLVGLSGSSEIGQPEVMGNSTKESMDATHVNDGWTGNAVVDDGDRGDPKSVYSDNGWDYMYDCGSAISLPLFPDDWRDMYTGAKVVNPATGAYYTHTEYFEDVLASTPYEGDMTINTKIDFYYNATRPGDPDPSHRQPNDDFILFDASSNLLEINGQVQVNGNLTMTGKANDKTINYTGRAALLANGDVVLDCDLLTVNADGSTANSFPVNNIIGIM